MIYSGKNKKSRSRRHTHYECVDNSGYLVSHIRIRCSVVASITDKQAGNCCSFPAAHQPGTQDYSCVATRRLQRYFLWCMLTAETVPHFAHFILMMPSAFVSMSKSRCLQIGHFTCTTTSDSIGISTCITPFYLFRTGRISYCPWP